MATAIKYMGSKRSLAPLLADLISERYPEAIVADAFAGTCSVGTALAPRHTVMANDAHAFSDFYLLALLHAVSHCAATPGHFAQFFVPRDHRNTSYIARILLGEASNPPRLAHLRCGTPILNIHSN